jgi:hypothetical protein
MLSWRESQEMAQNDEVLRWSTDSDVEERPDTTGQNVGLTGTKNVCRTGLCGKCSVTQQAQRVVGTITSDASARLPLHVDYHRGGLGKDYTR